MENLSILDLALSGVKGLRTFRHSFVVDQSDDLYFVEYIITSEIAKKSGNKKRDVISASVSPPKDNVFETSCKVDFCDVTSLVPVYCRRSIVVMVVTVRVATN